MREEVIGLLEELLPLVNLESEFLFSELSSLDITTIMLVLSEHYKVELSHEDVTPRNFKNIDSIVALVRSKQK
jgi:acyl carrier protein